ncbi:MAG: elongation factor 1-beta [Methanomicrobiaceae archaeon]|nr:elongation factor 1-beta [Methanomicrobiaceae archaeon]MDD5420286.1 elongation factor 1-beta [Methanomicrobiaceae archaeon]
MGSVAIILKIMPESPEVDIGALKESIRTQVPETRDIREEPIGFGLVALKIAVIVPDEAGAPDAVEQKLRELEGVGSAEIVELTLT